MATNCPLCSTGKLKKGAKMVYCENYKPQKEGNEWFNNGECEFHLPFANKVFGRTLKDSDIKQLLEGKTIKNSKGDTMTLDLDSEYFTRIDFATRPEDRDF
jgi:hypothetical protein